MMRRFDAMGDYRSGLASISSDLGLDPCAALSRLCGIQHAMALTLRRRGFPPLALAGFCGNKD